MANDQEQKKPEAVETQIPEPEFAIQRIYSKDISFEAPNTPEIFRVDWKPEVKLDMDISTKNLGEDLHEVTMKLTVTVNVAEKVAFLVEVAQAGIFLLKSFAKEQAHYMLGSFCPNILFPFGRELISDLVIRSGFPPLYLAPINFDAYYNQHLTQEKKEEKI